MCLIDERPLAPAPHRPVPHLAAGGPDWHPFLRTVPAQPVTAAKSATREDDRAVRLAGRARRLIPGPVHDALADFDHDSGPAGALLLRGLPVGSVPTTPASPTAATGKDRTSEHLLLAVARSLGHPVGYSAEHGGRVVQNLVPTREGAHRQTSTSSAVELEFHTETAFHPHRPRYLLLVCLRGDPATRTLLCSVDELIGLLDDDVRRVLHEPRFRTGVDESFGPADRTASAGPAAPVLSGDPERPILRFDADLMTGTDPEAVAALAVLGRLARAHRLGIALEAGDLLVVDNHRCIHGRTAFAARFDGTDRWLQRSFVVSDLSASAADRTGPMITTTFA